MNKSTRAGYILLPGANDGIADGFGVGDVWALKYNGEFDDGEAGTYFSGEPERAKANLDKFLNGENIDGSDIVIWYSAHFTHDPGGEVSHVVGPELKPINW